MPNTAVTEATPTTSARRRWLRFIMSGTPRPPAVVPLRLLRARRGRGCAAVARRRPPPVDDRRRRRLRAHAADLDGQLEVVVVVVRLLQRVLVVELDDHSV